MKQKRLFEELELTKENVRKWAEEEAAKEGSTVEDLLRQVVGKAYRHNLESYSKFELVQLALMYETEGVSKPACDMTFDELLDEITGESFENWDFSTIDDLITWFNGEGWYDS